MLNKLQSIFSSEDEKKTPDILEFSMNFTSGRLIISGSMFVKNKDIFKLFEQNDIDHGYRSHDIEYTQRMAESGIAAISYFNYKTSLFNMDDAIVLAVDFDNLNQEKSLGSIDEIALLVVMDQDALIGKMHDSGVVDFGQKEVDQSISENEAMTINVEPGVYYIYHAPDHFHDLNDDNFLKSKSMPNTIASGLTPSMILSKNRLTFNNDIEIKNIYDVNKKSTLNIKP